MHQIQQNCREKREEKNDGEKRTKKEANVDLEGGREQRKGLGVGSNICRFEKKRLGQEMQRALKIEEQGGKTKERREREREMSGYAPCDGIRGIRGGDDIGFYLPRSTCSLLFLFSFFLFLKEKNILKFQIEFYKNSKVNQRLIWTKISMADEKNV